jgi:hypothetical protein
LASASFRCVAELGRISGTTTGHGHPNGKVRPGDPKYGHLMNCEGQRSGAARRGFGHLEVKCLGCYKWAGFVLEKLGAQISDATSVIEKFAPDASSLRHPEKQNRLASIRADRRLPAIEIRIAPERQ